MGMARTEPAPIWDDDHTTGVPMRWVWYPNPSGVESVCLGEAAPIRVCKMCRCSRELCQCEWRRPGDQQADLVGQSGVARER